MPHYMVRLLYGRYQVLTTDAQMEGKPFVFFGKNARKRAYKVRDKENKRMEKKLEEEKKCSST